MTQQLHAVRELSERSLCLAQLETLAKEKGWDGKGDIVAFFMRLLELAEPAAFTGGDL